MAWFTRSAARQETDRLVRRGLLAIVVLTIAAALGQFTNYAFPSLRSEALDAGSEHGAAAAVATVGLGCCAAAVAIAAALRLRPVGLAGIAGPVLTWFLLVDRLTRLHHDVPHWKLAYVPIVAATFLAVFAIGRRLSARTTALMAWGMGILFVSFVIHAVGAVTIDKLDIAETSVWYQLKVLLKHCTELAGWLLVALALATGLTAHAAGPDPGRRRRTDVT